MDFRLLGNQFIPLLNNMAVLILVADVFSRTKVFEDITSGNRTLKNNLWVIFIMGFLSIYGTLNGIPIMGNVANIRNIGPMVAGFIGGPIVGLSTGLIGGVHRFFIGGSSALPCALATIISGLMAGFISKINKFRFIGIVNIVIFAALIELLHSTMVLFLYDIFNKEMTYIEKFNIALKIELITTLPRVILVSLGMGIFAFIMVSLRRTRLMKLEKEKTERELKVARDIQMSIVPKIFPTFPGNKEIEIFASIDPALEVAGDFYDFFFIDDRTVCFSIGDVADKGVPSSLFMAVTKTLLKAKYDKGMSTAELLFRVNNDLCEGNDNVMFVTLFVCIIDLDTGKVQFSNGGHNLPFKFTNKGEIIELIKTNGPALGVMPGAKYEIGEINLNKNEGLFLYTDGVNEAENKEGEFFGYDRLIDELKNTCQKTSKEIVQNMNRKVREFYKGIPAHDDVTIEVIRYFGKEQ